MAITTLSDCIAALQTALHQGPVHDQDVRIAPGTVREIIAALEAAQK
jgi:hypothetical protein